MENFVYFNSVYGMYFARINSYGDTGRKRLESILKRLFLMDF